MSDYYVDMKLFHESDKLMTILYGFDSLPEMMVFKDRIDALYKESEPEAHDCDCDCDQCAADRWEASRDAYD